MNKIIKQQLQKIKIPVVPNYDDNTEVMFIPKTTEETRQRAEELLLNHYYTIEVEDYIILPFAGFNLHENWNDNRIPTDHTMKVEITQVMGKMVKVEAVGANDGKSWFGWLPRKSIKTFTELF